MSICAFLLSEGSVAFCREGDDRVWRNIDASVEKDQLFACQFHPEKSSATGLRILRNFAEL